LAKQNIFFLWHRAFLPVRLSILQKVAGSYNSQGATSIKTENSAGKFPALKNNSFTPLVKDDAIFTTSLNQLTVLV